MGSLEACPKGSFRAVAIERLVVLKADKGMRRAGYRRHS